MPAPLKIYSSHNGKKTVFKSIHPRRVKMYCCGPTVYDFLHIGNFRGAVFYNFMRNWLEFSGYQVDYVYNFTDVDDKILARAEKEKTSPQSLTDKYIEEFQKDYRALKLKPHTHNPRATETIKEMLSLIEKLLAVGAAYVVEGDVFFSVKSFSGYGSLSKRKTEELISGIRVEPNKKKRDVLDFILWKKTDPKDGRCWDSPWGRGRPGWHLECTAMIHKYLGEEIDIHGGGTDLIFPHHENEKAQSESCCKKTYVHYWVHNNMIDMDGDKMSKSVGNIITMREFLSQYPGEVFKYLILSSHYRSRAVVSKNTVHQAVSALARVYSSLARAVRQVEEGGLVKMPHREFALLLQQTEEAVASAFNDDFATPKAFAEIFTLVKKFNSLPSTGASKEQLFFCAESFLKFFKTYGKALSLFQEEPADFLKQLDDLLLKRKNISRKQIDLMVEERARVRSQKNFSRADELRNQLTGLGIELRDSPKGTSWEVSKRL